MAWTQDELGNWYDDSAYTTTSSSIQDEFGNWYDPEVYYAANNTSQWWTPETEGDAEFLKFMQDAATQPSSTGLSSIVNTAFSALGAGAKDFLKRYLYDPATGKVNLAGIGTAAMGLYALMDQKNKQSGGYSKPVPKFEAVRQQIQYDDAGRRPGEAGRQYFTQTQFLPAGDAAARTTAQQAAAQEAAAILAAQPARPAPAPNPYAGRMNLSYATPAAQPAAASGVAQLPALPRPENLSPEGTVQMAQGGIAELARGGRYLSGPTDGMADKLPANIDGKQEAALSHGEFVVPADVVSHLGNGNSDAGAKKLYEMMARVRKARTGRASQGKQINPDSFMPGGQVGYASGGEVQHFQGGGTATTTSGGTTTTTPQSPGVPLDRSTANTLSPWVGDYVTTALGQGAAAAAQPFQAYKGPLTAGPSDLQQQAFAGASEVAGAGYTPTQFTTGTFDASAASRYMNPYLQAALEPQLAEMKRQADIRRMEDASRLTKAGAFGGSRQAIMESEGSRNLLDLQRKALGEGYATAYDKAMGQFNTEQGRGLEAQRATEASRQFGGEFGLKSLDALSRMGATQREIEQAGIDADRRQFEEEREYAYKMPQYMLNLLGNLPVGAQTSSTDQSGMAALQSNIAGLASLYQTLAKLGQTSKD